MFNAKQIKNNYENNQMVEFKKSLRSRMDDARQKLAKIEKIIAPNYIHIKNYSEDFLEVLNETFPNIKFFDTMNKDEVFDMWKCIEAFTEDKFGNIDTNDDIDLQNWCIYLIEICYCSQQIKNLDIAVNITFKAIKGVFNKKPDDDNNLLSPNSKYLTDEKSIENLAKEIRSQEEQKLQKIREVFHIKIDKIDKEKDKIIEVMTDILFKTFGLPNCSNKNRLNFNKIKKEIKLSIKNNEDEFSIRDKVVLFCKNAGIEDLEKITNSVEKLLLQPKAQDISSIMQPQSSDQITTYSMGIDDVQLNEDIFNPNPQDLSGKDSALDN